MAYTHPWKNVVSGGVLASTIDDEMSQIRLDLQERLLEVFDAIPLTAVSPLTIKDAITGKKVGKILMLSGYHFEIEGASVSNANGIRTVPSVNGPTRAALSLPIGVTITKIRWLLNNGDTASISAKLMSKPFATGATGTAEVTLTKATGGEELISSGTLSIVTVNTKVYWLEADKSGGASFDIGGVEITYTTPDSRNTL